MREVEMAAIVAGDPGEGGKKANEPKERYMGISSERGERKSRSQALGRMAQQAVGTGGFTVGHHMEPVPSLAIVTASVQRWRAT
jgi:hypothetical protein